MGIFQILPQLFLSNRRTASCRHCLLNKNITHILTIETETIYFTNCEAHNQCSVKINGEIKTKFIYAMDMLDFNLLKVFEEVVNFIDEAISEKSANHVLVHWYV